ncbi:hypothetical protein KVG91_16345, partial [Pseudomonas sp. SWRI103]|nr:hypothetical protein [Pseudomonas azadiae]
GRGTEWWGEDFLVTFCWAGIPVLQKVTRCKSGTASRRYIKNGYVHGQQQQPGRPEGRHERRLSTDR